MTDTPLLILDILGARVRARVTWNDVVLLDDDLRVQLSRSMKINGWTVTGPNRLIVELAASPPLDGETGGRDQEPLPPLFEIKLRQAHADTPDEADDVRVDFEWPAERPLPVLPSVVVDQTVPLASPQIWSWQNGYRFATLGTGDVQDIIHHLETLRAALEQRDIETVVRLQSTQLSEQATALGAPPGSFTRGYAEFLSELMSGAGWRVDFFPPRLIGIQSMADGRVMHVTGSDGGPPIRTSSSTANFAIDPYVARIDGQWTIVR